jgi:hypothetical protein
MQLSSSYPAKVLAIPNFTEFLFKKFQNFKILSMKFYNTFKNTIYLKTPSL